MADFGIAKDVESTMQFAATFVGTSLYMSPERVEGQRACDCWGGRCWFYPELPWGVPPHWKASQSPYSKVDPAPTLDPARLHQPADAE